eukprot:comp15060_c0_seq1/m.22416 comp15060_c0_seq1/g.22416  ORF comp15060_c0_seq1/g.22416 comp15060_c0_seq1/m.22416 type:complete len:512 (-) comp15060_c0_seq1:22-1557(-)
MARVRKEMKGGSQLKKRAGSGKRGDDALGSEAARVAAEEARRAKEEALRVVLKDRLADEERHARLNRLKLQDHWRALMRKIRSAELSKELDVLAQTFERTVDRKEALIQLLERDLDEAEEQYQMALRSHLQNVDSLVELHGSRLRAMDGQFTEEVTALQNEYDAERAKINAGHIRVMQELNDIMASMEADHNEATAEAKQAFQTAKGEIKDKTSEEFNILRIMLESQIEQLGNQFEQLHKRYEIETDTRTKQFKALTKSDHENSKTIEANQRKLQRKHEDLAHWKTKLQNNIRECEERNRALRAEKDTISKHFHDLKARMNAFRNGESKRLTDLTNNAREAIKRLTEQIERAENIIKMAELNRKMESERERVQPFYHSTIEDKDVITEDDNEQPILEGLELLQSAAVFEDGSPVPEWGYLQNFFKRFNKVSLDSMAIKREKERLLRENDQLRSMLKQFLDGISVNDEILATRNPLFIVNNKTNVHQEPMVRPNEIPVVEGNKEVRTHRLLG